MSDKS